MQEDGLEISDNRSSASKLNTIQVFAIETSHWHQQETLAAT